MVGAFRPINHAAFLAQSTGFQTGPLGSSSWKTDARLTSSLFGAQQQASPPLQDAQAQTVTHEASLVGAGLPNWIAGSAGIATSAYQTTTMVENQVERNTPRTDLAAFQAGGFPGGHSTILPKKTACSL